MSSIVTVTINPTIDKTTSVPSLIPEKKLTCSAPIFEPGGGGINVARAIKKLEGDATAVFLSGGYNGNLLKKLLTKENVNSLAIEIQNDTRENMIVLDTAANLQYRFGMPGPIVTEKEWQQCLYSIEQMNDISFLVASGSLSPGVPSNIFAHIASIAKKKGAKLVVDTSGEALKLAVKEGVYLLKPNLAELASLTGKDELHPGEITNAAKQLIDNADCEAVVVSMGAAGALLVAKGIVQQIAAPPVIRKSTVGAGDSMVAGIVWSLFDGKSLLEAVQYGVAAGTAATMNPGTELCRLADVEKLYRAMRTTQ